jgi:hypothetical protein
MASWTVLHRRGEALRVVRVEESLHDLIGLGGRLADLEHRVAADDGEGGIGRRPVIRFRDERDLFLLGLGGVLAERLHEFDLPSCARRVLRRMARRCSSTL